MRVLGLLNQLKLIKRPDKEFRQGFTGAPAIAGREGEQLPLRRGAGPFYGVRVWVFSGVGWRGA